MPRRGEDRATSSSEHGAAWSVGIVAEAALHPISVRLYADAPYIGDLFGPGLLHRVVHPANATIGKFSHPLHLGSANRRWYLPGSAADLLLHTSCVASCCLAVIRSLSPFTEASDIGPPLVTELSAGSFGFHSTMMHYWSRLESETFRHLKAGFTHILFADVSRCIESMDSGLMFAQLEDAQACADSIRVLKAMHQTWHAAGCRGLPLTAGFRVLIKLYMKDVDDRLRADGITFLRLQDDFRIFCRGEHEARHAQSILSEALATSGLTLNPNKTLLLSRKQLHFSWQKRSLDWKRCFRHGIGYPLLSDALAIAPLRKPAIHLLNLFYSNRWTAA
ncbi:MAG: RNA-directed DNA polymerase [Acidobacteriota bacterium]